MINIREIFSKVVTGNRYDLKAVAKHTQQLIDAQVNAWQLPSLEKDFVEKHHVGGSLQYSMVLFFKLRRNSIESYIAISKVENPKTHEKTGTYMSVFYIHDGKEFFADPAEAVKTGNVDDFYEIPVKDYLTKHGTVTLHDPFGDWGEHLFFSSFFSLPNRILEKD